MLSASDAWTVVSDRPAVVRTAPDAASWSAPDAEALLADVTAGLCERFTDVLAVDAATGPAGVHLLHAATGPDGEGVAVGTVLAGDGTVFCWVSPTTAYAADRDAAHRLLTGRPPLVPSTQDRHPGVRVAEAHLTVSRPGPQWDTVFACRGPLAYELPTGVAMPASTVVAHLWERLALGPRAGAPVPTMVLTTRPALDRLLAATPTGPTGVRAALDAPDLPERESAALAALCRDLAAHWWLEWA